MNILSDISFLSICTGCGLCANICSNNAISMQVDDEGFLSPHIEIEKCNECGDCLKCCPLLSKSECASRQPIEVYACQIFDKKLLIDATAGGLFPLLAQCILDQNGVVYGAAYDNNMKVVHCAAYNMEGVKRFSGSKYVQSDASKTFGEIKELLKKDKKVLFSGTPCQVDAVIRYCDYSELTNLYTVDVVCYGVPSPKLFRMYLDTVEKQYNRKIIDFSFRDKHSNGWSHTTVIQMQDSKGNVTILEEPDYSKIPYYRMFGCRDCYRRSCYHCKYNKVSRISDITTGNFWGIEKLSASFETKLGVSMALINTDKGKNIFSSIQSKMIVEKRTLDEAIQANEALVNVSSYPPKRDRIYACLNKHGFSEVIKRYYSTNWYRKLRNKLSTTKNKIFKKW